MEPKEKYMALRNDPRRILKTIRLGEGSDTRCYHCDQLVHTEPATTELAKRIDNETLVFFQKCPICGHKLYWREYHCFTHNA